MRKLTLDQFAENLASRLRVELPRPVNAELDLYGDLALDSFQAFEMLLIVEAMAGCLVPPMDLPELYTLGDVYAYYETLSAIEIAEAEAEA